MGIGVLIDIPQIAYKTVSLKYIIRDENGGLKVCNTNCYEAGTDGEMCSAWTKKPTAEADEET